MRLAFRDRATKVCLAHHETSHEDEAVRDLFFANMAPSPEMHVQVAYGRLKKVLLFGRQMTSKQYANL